MAAGWKLKCIVIKMAKLLIPAKCLKSFVDGCESGISSSSIPALNAHMPVLLKHLKIKNASSTSSTKQKLQMAFRIPALSIHRLKV